MQMRGQDRLEPLTMLPVKLECAGQRRAHHPDHFIGFLPPQFFYPPHICLSAHINRVFFLILKTHLYKLCYKDLLRCLKKKQKSTYLLLAREIRFLIFNWLKKKTSEHARWQIVAFPPGMFCPHWGLAT